MVRRGILWFLLGLFLSLYVCIFAHLIHFQLLSHQSLDLPSLFLSDVSETNIRPRSSPGPEASLNHTVCFLSLCGCWLAPTVLSSSSPVLSCGFHSNIVPTVQLFYICWIFFMSLYLYLVRFSISLLQLCLLTF